MAVNSAVSGPIVSVIGIGTVFVALSLLVAVLSLLAKILNKQEAAESDGRAEPGQAATEAAPAAATDQDELLRVALAAYGLHQRYRHSVRGPAAPSAWALAGRARQVMRDPRRG